jgi:hypothetical protein
VWGGSVIMFNTTFKNISVILCPRVIHALNREAVVVVIVWLLDLQLTMQSVPITTKVLSSNPAQVRCTRYNIM